MRAVNDVKTVGKTMSRRHFGRSPPSPVLAEERAQQQLVTGQRSQGGSAIMAGSSNSRGAPANAATVVQRSAEAQRAQSDLSR
jgi:hypothetical protein